VIRPTIREIKSPLALATLGAFFVPEPLGTCLILAAAIWWLCRKRFHGADFDILLEASERRIDFYRFRAGQNAAVLFLLPDDTDYSQAEAFVSRYSPLGSAPDRTASVRLTPVSRQREG
jgi:hypothetical protein